MVRHDGFVTSYFQDTTYLQCFLFWIYFFTLGIPILFFRIILTYVLSSKWQVKPYVQLLLFGMKFNIHIENKQEFQKDKKYICLSNHSCTTDLKAIISCGVYNNLWTYDKIKILVHEKVMKSKGFSKSEMFFLIGKKKNQRYVDFIKEWYGDDDNQNNIALAPSGFTCHPNYVGQMYYEYFKSAENVMLVDVGFKNMFGIHYRTIKSSVIKSIFLQVMMPFNICNVNVRILNNQSELFQTQEQTDVYLTDFYKQYNRQYMPTLTIQKKREILSIV